MESLTCVEGTMENLRCVHTTGPRQTVNMESRVLLCQTSSLSGVVSTSLVTTQHEKPVSDNSLVLCWTLLLQLIIICVTRKCCVSPSQTFLRLRLLFGSSIIKSHVIINSIFVSINFDNPQFQLQRQNIYQLVVGNIKPLSIHHHGVSISRFSWWL